MGGHVSKAHAGMNLNFIKKQVVRIIREVNRKLHKVSLNLYQKAFPIDDIKKYNRTKMRHIKEFLINEDPTFESLQEDLLYVKSYAPRDNA